jgi:acetyl-CoA C-acetyltransferase
VSGPSDVVICEPVRTLVDRYHGALQQMDASALASAVIRGLPDRTGLPPDEVEDAILGQCHPNGEAPAIGRVAAMDAGFPPACRACRSTGNAALALWP